MSQMAKSAREKLKAKARSLAASKAEKVDSSDWSPAEPLNADAKTGMRPISQRAYKGGGKVDGKAVKARADRKARKSGGRVETEIGVGMANKNMKEANKARPGVKHIGGFKDGGAADGGVKDKKALGAIDPSPKRGKAEHYKKGGKAKKADGGETMGSRLVKGLHRMTGYKSPAEKMEEGLKGVGKGQTADYSQEERGELNRMLSKDSSLPEPAEAMERSGKYQDYKKGGRANRDMGGKIKEALNKAVGYKSPGQKLEEGLKNVGKGETATYSAEERERLGSMAEGRKSGGRKWIQEAIEKPGALRKALKVKEGEKIPAKKLEAAAEKGGKLGKRARLAQTLGRMNRATGGATMDLAGMKKAAKKPSGKGKTTNIEIKIIAGKEHMRPNVAGMKPSGADDMPPMMPPGVGAPPPAAPPGLPAMPLPGAAPGGMPMPPGRKAGGRITKVASSYKDMQAGAASGEGRLQKTDIARRHGDAPARKEGGRISRVARSYKDMTAGAGSGEGRLQKEDIAKAKAGRGK